MLIFRHIIRYTYHLVFKSAIVIFIKLLVFIKWVNEICLKEYDRFQLIFLIIAQECIQASVKYQWAVVGAGPAGITTISALSEFGVDLSTVIWIDPEFNVGRMGKYYRNVPSNTKIKQLVSYINSCIIFKEFASANKDAHFSCNLEEFYPLHIIIDPLIDATNYLRSQVTSLQDMVIDIDSDADDWILECMTTTVRAHKVILATGSHPKQLDYGLPTIPSDEAIDKDKLASYVNSNDCIAIFGGMHSAMLILKYLSELGAETNHQFLYNTLFS